MEINSNKKIRNALIFRRENIRLPLAENKPFTMVMRAGVHNISPLYYIYIMHVP